MRVSFLTQYEPQSHAETEFTVKALPTLSLYLYKTAEHFFSLKKFLHFCCNTYREWRNSSLELTFWEMPLFSFHDQS